MGGIPVELVRRPDVVGEALGFGATGVALDRIPVYEQEEGLEPLGNASAYRWVRADVPNAR